MYPPRPRGLVSRLRGYDPVVEVGVGDRPEIAGALARDATVTATDIVPREVPAGVRFVLDDITSPDPGVYAGVELVYALKFPPELHEPALRVARDHDAALAFTTLGYDPPAVPARPEPVPVDTLFWARE